jgi:cyclase
VSTAIDEGRSVEATLEAVEMPRYGGYSLFEWAHHSVNVPAVYQHLRDLRGGEV